MYYDGECLVGAVVENGLIAKENGGRVVFVCVRVIFLFVFITPVKDKNQQIVLEFENVQWEREKN